MNGLQKNFKNIFQLKTMCHQALLKARRTCTSRMKYSTEAKPHKKEGSYRMNRWQFDGYSGLDGLVLANVRIPPLLKPGDILIKVSAASVNPLDTAMISGYGSGMLNIMRMMGNLERGIVDMNHIEFPLTVGRDFAGEVVAIGHGVTDVSIGDEVFGVVSPHCQGSHAEYVITPSSNVARIPEGVSPEDAASLPYAGLTAYSATVVSGMLIPSSAPGKRVLVLGASGGVGTFLCQMLSAWGAEVVGVCSADAMELVMSLGATYALDYRDPVTKEILLGDAGFDLIIDAAGTDDIDYMKALKPWVGASYVTLSPPFLRNADDLGVPGGVLKSLREVVCRNVTTLREGRAYKWAFFMPNPWALKLIATMLKDNKIRAVIDRVFSFEEVPSAYESLLKGHTRGKVIIKVP
ncbi:reticulon-4-interacting protein 1 homolog, mitochondrial-like [Palaemon carinicauda]|uniref:reticulon-4-interacting protein 1 homolog, mitochondrial-like n=1 Tax=Palaemon carinicauda TaxID=392227 RepID=UPI0035B5D46B